MEKRDKENRRSFDDMSAEREAEVNAGLEAASDRMADAQAEAMLANINRRIDGLKDRVKNTAINIGAPQSSLGIEREDIQGNAGDTFKRGMNKSRFNVQKDLSEKADVARQEAAIAASDRMAEAQGEAILANIKKRTDEVKGEKERKRNYHLLQQAAIRENENSRVKNMSVNVGAPQAPLNFEPEGISDNADRTFKRSMNKNQYGVRQDFGKRALAAEAEAAIAASDRMADKQAEGMLANINGLIAKRERDIADKRAAAERKAKYLSDQQAAINANRKQAEQIATPAGDGQKKAEIPGKTDVPGDTENVRKGRAARAANYDANSTQEKPAIPAGGSQGVSAETEAESVAAAGRAARNPNYEEDEQAEQIATPAGDGQKKAEIPGKTDVPGGETKKKPAGTPAPLVHNAEEQFKKNVEGVKENLKYEHINQLIKEIEDLRDKNKVSEKDEKRKKRWEKAAQIIAGILDGVQSVSNIVFAAKGIHPFNMNKTVSGDIQGRLSQFNKDLEDRRAKYLALSEKVAALRQNVQEMKDEDEARKAAQELAKAKLEAELYDKDWNRKFHTDEANRDQRNKDADRELKGKALNHTIENDNANLGIRKQQANAATTNARANATRAAIYVRNGGGGTKYEFQDKTYGNKDAWGAAIKREAKRLNIPLSEKYKTTDPLGRARTSERPKPIDQLLTEVNDALATQGGGSGNGNKGGKGKGY